MTTFSIIQKSQLEGAHRLDAEYYQPEYLKVRKKLQSAPVLGSLFAGMIRDPMGYGFDYEAFGVPYYRIDDLFDPFLDNNPVFISEAAHQKLKRTQLRHGDLIMAVRGATIGRLGLFTDKSEANISPNVIILRPKDTTWSKYFAIFISSRMGKTQIEWMLAGTGQPTITTDQIRELRIPTSKKLKEQVDALYDDAVYHFNGSRKLYSQAENLLLEKLGLEKFEEGSDLYTIVRLSELKEKNRMDAEYFQPKYEKLMSLIRANRGIALGELVSIKKGFEPGSDAYQDKGKLFIRVSSLSKDGITDKDQKYLKDELYQKLKKDYQPKVGEILLTKDATPGIAYLVKESVEGIIAGGVLRLDLKEEIEPEYLALIINSPVGRTQVERDAGGSVIAHWKPEQIKNTLIPLLPMPTQRKIANLVRRSHEARKKAKELLEEAKQRVEQYIEQRISYDRSGGQN